MSDKNDSSKTDNGATEGRRIIRWRPVGPSVRALHAIDADPLPVCTSPAPTGGDSCPPVPHDEAEALGAKVADLLQRELEAERAAKPKHAPAKIINDEPEQMKLWRDIIERRDRWAAVAKDCQEYKERQRQDIEEMRTREAESGIVHADETLETDRKALELSESFLDGPRDLFLGLIDEMDAEIVSKSAESTKSNKRGLAMSQLRTLARAGKEAAWSRDEAIAYVVFWLERQYSKRGKGKKHRVESNEATLAYEAAEAVLRRVSPIEAIDLNGLEQIARAERDEASDWGTHTKIAERIVRLALDE